MGRIRTIKPDFFVHEELYQIERETGFPLRITYAGLLTVADREGRFEWKPNKLKLAILPWDLVEFDRVLDALATRGFLVKYEKDGKIYGAIPSFKRHQVINNKERASELPDFKDCTILPTRIERDEHACPTPLDLSQGEGKGREGNRKGKEGNKYPTDTAKKAQLFIATYCTLFKEKYGSNPEIMGKDSGIASRVVKNLSEEKIDLYLNAYFSMPDAWVIKAKHPLPIFETKLNEISVFAKTGSFVTNKQVHQADDHASTMMQLQRIREGKL